MWEPSSGKNLTGTIYGRRLLSSLMLVRYGYTRQGFFVQVYTWACEIMLLEGSTPPSACNPPLIILVPGDGGNVRLVLLNLKFCWPHRDVYTTHATHSTTFSLPDTCPYWSFLVHVNFLYLRQHIFAEFAAEDLFIILFLVHFFQWRGTWFKFYPRMRNWVKN